MASARGEPAAQGTACEEAIVGRWRVGGTVSTIGINPKAKPKHRVVVQIPKRKPSVGSIDCTGAGSVKLAINFAGDPGCCSGTLLKDQRTIQWSNGTRWIKQ